MNEHEQLVEWLPLYVTGRLNAADRQAVERHLVACADCRAEVALWRAVATEIVAADQALSAPPDLAARALARLPTRAHRPARLRQALALLQAQAPLLRRELWPATALVFVLGYCVARMAGATQFIQAFAPLVAAASFSIIYGPEHDAAAELTLATPTSPWQILLARLTLVFGYDLLLALAASFGLMPLLPPAGLGALILSWLGPMAFLSALALVLSLWIGTENAITLTYGAWLVRWLATATPTPLSPLVSLTSLAGFFRLYERFWETPLLLLALAGLLLALALWLAGRMERSLPRWV